ncbi:hypothetical protein DF035_20060 [Burkholderia contaminans]|nr:hypothetical protein DF035_20060 [Burkholderia contaminans]
MSLDFQNINKTERRMIKLLGKFITIPSAIMLLTIYANPMLLDQRGIGVTRRTSCFIPFPISQINPDMKTLLIVNARADGRLKITSHIKLTLGR